MKKLVIATKNKKKKKELQELVKSLKVRVANLADLGTRVPCVIEDGRTFRQNAIKKAITYSRYVDALVVADDSGLVVNALGGRPGVRSSRFASTNATDKENNAKLLGLMKDIPKGKRQAMFVCVIALAKDGQLLATAEGNCKGKLAFERKGKSGFGYDPLFIPTGFKKTFAELTSSSKNRISHRGRALKKAKSAIQKYL